MTLKNNKTFCVLPWIHLHANPDSEVRPCCIASTRKYKFGKLKDSTIDELWNSQSYMQIRKNMLKGLPTQVCETCYKVEKYGSNSLRNNMNDKWLSPELEQVILNNTDSNGKYTNQGLLYWDIRYSNICNFKCRMCGPGLSTKWYEDVDGWTKTYTCIDNIKEWCDNNKEYLKSLKEIYFAGGEPLVQKQHYEFLEWCIENNIYPNLHYQSNGSKLNYGKWNIFNLWKQFPYVAFSLSLDGFGKIGEYIRTGYVDSIVKDNMNKILDFMGNNHSILINSTWQIYNCYYMTEFFDEVDKYDWVLNNNNYTQLLVNPEYLQPKVLPQSLKNDSIAKIKSSKWYQEYPHKFESVLNNLEEQSIPMQWNKFVKYSKNLDNIRKESLSNVFPEIRKFYES